MLHQSSGRWRLGLVLCLLTTFLWGILPIALEITLQSLDAYTLTWFRFLVSFTILAGYLAVRGKLPTRQQLSFKIWKLLAIAIVFLASNYILFLEGLGLTSPSNTEVIIQLAPFLMGFGGLIVFKERYTLTQWIGVSVLSLGFIVFFHENLTNLIYSQGKYLFGTGLVVLGAVTWAIYGLAQKQLLQNLSSAQIMLLIYGACTLLFTPFAIPKAIITLNYLHLGMLIFCAFNTLIAYGAFAESLQHWEASRVSAVIALAPIITLLSVFIISVIAPSLIAPEKITFIAVIGAFLVVSGSMAIALGKRSDNQ